MKLRRFWSGKLPQVWEGTSFLRKWGLIGVLIGVGAGLGAIALIYSIHLVNRTLLATVVG